MREIPLPENDPRLAESLEKFLEMEPPNGLTHREWAQAMYRYLLSREAKEARLTMGVFK